MAQARPAPARSRRPVPAATPFSAPAAAERSGFRLPSLTGLLVRLLVLVFVGMAAWKLAWLGLETYEASRFTRPPIVAQPSLAASPATDEGLDNILRQVALPGGTVAVYVQNLSTDVGDSVNSDPR